MPIQRRETITIASAHPDDYGNVDITVETGNQILTPEEARTLANELTVAAISADIYRTEQAHQAGAA